MMRSGRRTTGSLRSRICCGLASWIDSHGWKYDLLALIRFSRFIFSACCKRTYGSVIGERAAT